MPLTLASSLLRRRRRVPRCVVARLLASRAARSLAARASAVRRERAAWARTLRWVDSMAATNAVGFRSSLEG
jgi:hypothetical protein